MPTQKDSYNPDSYNAVFARIEQKLEDISNDIKEIKKKRTLLRKKECPVLRITSTTFLLSLLLSPWWQHGHGTR